MKKQLQDYGKSFSFVGLVVATLFFAGSVTPSLLPRPYFVQGILSGVSLAIGYAVGVASVWSWQFLELQRPGPKLERWSKRVTMVIVTTIVIVCVWRMTQWQNSIREVMELPRIDSAYPMRFFLMAIVLGCLLVGMGRLILAAGARLSRSLNRYLPRRIAIASSAVVVSSGVIFIANGLVAKGLLNLADQFFLRADEFIDEGMEQPVNAFACGSPDSLIDWETIGRCGKDFIVGGPTFETISEFKSEEATQPIRVYVGLRTAEDEEDRATLALEELKRVGAFNRKVMVIATPTGTGWLDEGAVDTIEYMHGGDTAIVCTQYSYLPSWITILVDPNRSIDPLRSRSVHVRLRPLEDAA